MAEFESPSNLETKVEQLASIIVKVEAEHWEEKNKALMQIIALISHFEGESEDTIHDFLSPKLFKSLKDPIRILISDLRSQQVRDACQLLVKLSEIYSDGMKHFLREIFAYVIEGIKVPNKVMSGYVDDCIRLMIENCCFKSAVIFMVNEVRENKAKVVRERCMDYLNEIMSAWPLSDSEIDPIADAVRIGLEDASVKCRETARLSYFKIVNMFPKKAIKIKSLVSKPLQQKLTSQEKEAGLDTSSLSTRSVEDLNASIRSNASDGDTSAGTPRLKKAMSMKRPTRHESGMFVSNEKKIHAKSSNDIRHTDRDGHAHPVTNPNPVSCIRQPLSKRSGANDVHANMKLTDPYSHAKSTLDLKQLGRPGGFVAGSTPVTSTSTSSNARVKSKGGITHSHAELCSSMDSGSGSPISQSVPAMEPSDSHGEVSSFSSLSDLPTATSRRRSVVKNPFEQMVVQTQTKPPPSLTVYENSELNISAPCHEKSSIDKAISTAYETVASSSATMRKLGGQGASSGSPDALDDAAFSSKLEPEIHAEVRPSAAVEAPESVKKTSDQISIGLRVRVSRTNNSTLSGTVRFLGHTMFASGQWVGIELDTADGKNNGSVLGHYYFSCIPNYGLFAREDCVEPLYESALVSTEASASLSNATRKGSESSNTHSIPKTISTSVPSTSGGSAVTTSPGRMSVAERKSSWSNLREVMGSRDKSPESEELNRLCVTGPSHVGASLHGDSQQFLPTAESTIEFANTLKLKLSQLMDYLNQQLEIVVDLEREGEKMRIHPEQKSLITLELRKEVLSITQQEQELIGSFQKRMLEKF